jgi:hypothetical protein
MVKYYYLPSVSTLFILSRYESQTGTVPYIYNSGTRNTANTNQIIDTIKNDQN